MLKIFKNCLFSTLSVLFIPLAIFCNGSAWLWAKMPDYPVFSSLFCFLLINDAIASEMRRQLDLLSSFLSYFRDVLFGYKQFIDDKKLRACY